MQRHSIIILYKISPEAKFIRRTFHIDRHDFSLTIKDTDIQYNKITHLYDIEKCHTNNENKSNFITNVIPKKHANSDNCKSNTISYDKCIQKLDYLVENFDELKKIIGTYNEKLDVLNNKLLIDVNDLRKQGDAKPACFRIYKNIYADFRKFVKKNKEYKSMDIVSVALLEYMEKYSK